MTLSGLKGPTALPNLKDVLISFKRDTFIGMIKTTRIGTKSGAHYPMEVMVGIQELNIAAEMMVATKTQSYSQQITHSSCIVMVEGVSELRVCATLSIMLNGTIRTFGTKTNAEVAILIPHVDVIRNYTFAITAKSK